jgi:hypothetical protein
MQNKQPQMDDFIDSDWITIEDVVLSNYAAQLQTPPDQANAYPRDAPASQCLPSQASQKGWSA